MYYYSVLGGLLSGEFPESYQRYGESRRRLGTLSYETIRRERAIFGEPSYCLERIHHIREVLGSAADHGLDEYRRHAARQGVTARCGCLPSGCCRRSHRAFHLPIAALRSGVLPASNRRPYMSQNR